MLVFKGAIAALLLISYLGPKIRKRIRAFRRWYAVPAHLRSANVRRRARRQSLAIRLRSTDWIKVFRIVSMSIRLSRAALSPNSAGS